ncbi:Secreted subtilisin-like serine protease sub4 [Phlyctochytrium bullatum]|nr:Secreted subtilisin-like serine protease sub4 [Phlyctochytrium bullatum]
MDTMTSRTDNGFFSSDEDEDTFFLRLGVGRKNPNSRRPRLGLPGDSDPESESEEDQNGTSLIPEQEECRIGTTAVFEFPELPRAVEIHEDSSQGCGGKTWEAAGVMASHLMHRFRTQVATLGKGEMNNNASELGVRPSLLAGRRVVELGAGTGVVGILAAMLMEMEEKMASESGLTCKQPGEVVITDMLFLDLMQKNVDLNLNEEQRKRARIQVFSAPTEPTYLEEEYIVVYKPKTPAQKIVTHESWLKAAATNFNNTRIQDDPNYRTFPSIEPFNKFRYLKKYNHTNFKGYTAKISSGIAAQVQSLPEVAYVEKNQVVYAYATQFNVPSWGLGRVSSPILGGTTYTYPNAAGQNVNVYVLDTGVNILHTDFQGRATNGVNQAGTSAQDFVGHGTHVAGTMDEIVGGATYGIAKKASLINVKVLGDNGSGTVSSILAGITWAINHANLAKRRCVINMSLGSSYSQAFNDAVQNAVSNNCVVVAAAGNSKDNACSYSPGSAPSAITVGATTNTDALASYSNFGSCVDILAPGSAIVST